MPHVVVVHDGDFIGVAAPSEPEAVRALKALKAEWNVPAAEVSSKTLYDHIRKTRREATTGPGGGPRRTGSVDDALKSADLRLDATYTVPYIAHVPMETRAAVAHWEGDKLTAWTGTQRPFGVRSELAGAFKIPEDRVRVIVPDTGAGYGGKHTGEAALEAARLARAAGRPVKLVWTREEEFTWAYVRPAGVIDVSAAVRKDGTLVAWKHVNLGSGNSGVGTNYDVPNPQAEYHPAGSPLRGGSYRALASTANHFARETHMDELAHALGLDPLAFRLKNLKDARLHAVLEAAAKSFGWGAKPDQGRGFGLACGTEKGGYIATCAEVAVDRESGKVQVLRAVAAMDCGAIVNPDGLKRPGRRLPHHGPRRRALRGDRVRGRQAPQPEVLEVPRPSLPRHPRDRGRPDRPQGSALGRGRRSADRRDRAGYRECDLPGHGRPAPVVAAGAEGREGVSGQRSSPAQTHPGVVRAEGSATGFPPSSPPRDRLARRRRLHDRDTSPADGGGTWRAVPQSGPSGSIGTVPR